MKEQFTQKNIWVIVPVFGIIIFVALYIIAAMFYPGGSQVDKNSIGFSWINNYWCNLLSEKAINGQHNSAKPFAIAAMVILCFSLLFFWFLFPLHIKIQKWLKLTIQVSCALSMITGFLLLTNLDHDNVVNLSSSFASIAVMGTVIGLYKNKLYLYFVFGLFTMLLFGLNYYFYHTKGLMIYLPVLQKITFASFLIWTCGVDMNLYHSNAEKK